MRPKAMRLTTSAPDLTAPTALNVSVSDDSLTVELSDGRTISVPTAWFPRLLHGSRTERENWRLIGRGEGVHWPDLDEDISVVSLIEGRASMESASSLQRWLDARSRDDKNG